MGVKERKLLKYNLAIESLIEGKTLNEIGLKNLKENLVSDSFEEDIRKKISVTEYKRVSPIMVYENLTKSLVELNDTKMILFFARTVNKLDMIELAKVVINKRDFNAIEQFAKINGAPKEMLTKAAFDYGTIDSIFSFYNHVNDISVDMFEDALIRRFRIDIYIDERDINRFIDYVYNTNYCSFGKRHTIKKFEEAVIQIGDSRLIIYFATKIKDANIDNLLGALLKKEKYFSLLSFVELVDRVKRRHFEIIRDVIIKNNDKANEYKLKSLGSEIAELDKCPQDIAEELICYSISN